MRHFVGIALLVLAASAIVTLALLAGCGVAAFTVADDAIAKSVEFVTTQAGAPRFQRYETNEGGLEVIVDAETGVAYIQTTNGVTALLDADGTPETVSEVGE